MCVCVHARARVCVCNIKNKLLFIIEYLKGNTLESWSGNSLCDILFVSAQQPLVVQELIHEVSK
jgi:hypothetical protein